MKLSSPNGLATIALLKARLDKNQDYLDLFMPFITDAIVNLSKKNFTVIDVKEKLQELHEVIIPHDSIGLLLRRLSKAGKLKFEAGHYVNINKVKSSGVLEAKHKNEKLNNLLASELIEFSNKQNFEIDSNEKALKLIFSFLEDNKITLLLNTNDLEEKQDGQTTMESKIIAEFVQSVVFKSLKLSNIFKNILEGLVVYNTATLQNVNFSSSKLKGLKVYIDSQFLFQLLGYEDDAHEKLAKETINLLKNSGIQLLVFDKTVSEMQRILKFHEKSIFYPEGMRRMAKHYMGRYFLSKSYKPSDIRQLSALLLENLGKNGITEGPIPRHIIEFTLDEKKLSNILSDKKNDEKQDYYEEPRVVHDVDCAAAILTLRKHNRSRDLARSKYVFATSSYHVVSGVQKWYRQEGENTIGPFIHIRSLSNTAWLKKPELSANLKIHELVILCQSILKPEPELWKRFIEHLDKLEKNQEITSDESVAIVISDLTGELLSDLEEDADATSMDEVIYRVKEKYKSEADQEIEKVKLDSEAAITKIKSEADERLEQAKTQTHEAGRETDKIKHRLDEKASNWAKGMSWTFSVILYVILFVVAIISFFSQATSFSVFGIVLFTGTTIYFLVGWFGDVGYVTNIREKSEKFLLPKTRSFFGAESNKESQHLSIFNSEE